MFLLSKETVGECANAHMTSFLDFKLLGFMPCSDKGSYYCFETKLGKIVPVFLGKLERKIFSDHKETDVLVKEKPWILFFKGCDDGSYGLRFETEDSAISWIREQKEVDFYMIFMRWEERETAENEHKNQFIKENVLWYN